jgi:dienelactone hydrolase
MNAALVLLAAAAPLSPQQLATTFSYDAKGPLDVNELSKETRAGAEVHDLTYASPKGGRVPAYLVTPPGKGPFAGIVYMHWGQGNRSEFIAEALLAARAGAASIMIDAPYLRKGFKPPPCEDAGPEDYLQLITDLRRAVDVLLARVPVDAKRLAYVGHSLGATWGGTLAAVEPRFGSLVLMGGLPRLTEAMREHFRKHPLPPEKARQMEECMARVEPIESVSHVARATAPILFQFARVDRFITEKAAQTYAAAAPASRTIKWYEGGHEFTDPAALVDRLEWLQKRLTLQPVRMVVEQWTAREPPASR